MVTYEVNLHVEKEIAEQFKQWLTEHIEHILNYQGFIQATISEFNTLPDLEIDDIECLTVSYQVDSMENLQHYLDNHAKLMRDDGIKHFGERFQAARRILSNQQTITS